MNPLSSRPLLFPVLSKNLFFFILLCAISPPLAAAERVKISIEGVAGALQKNVLAHLSLVPQKDHPRLNRARIDLLHQSALAEVKAALEPFGYYQPSLDIQVEALAPAKTSEGDTQATLRWQVTYRITKGNPVKVSELDLQLLGEGQEDALLSEKIDHFPLTIGDVLVHSQYESGKTSLLRQAQEQGYFKAKLSRAQIQVRPERQQASIHLHLQTGKRYRFGTISFEQDSFDEDFLRRYVSFKQGDFYNNKALLDLRRDLTNSPYFADAEVVADRANPTDNDEIPIAIRLKPEEPNRYTASIGYGTDTGLRGGLGWERRYRGRHGHFYRLDLMLSEKTAEFSALYGIPTGDPRTDSLSGKFGYKMENLAQKESELLLAGVTKTHARNFWKRQLRENWSLEYRYETYQLGTQPEVTSKLLVPGVNWSYLQADDPVYTRQGYRLSWGVKGALKDVASDTSILQTTLQAAYIFSLGEKSRILTRSELGMSWMPDFDDVPASMRFFAGGDRSVRGYDYDTLGPSDDTGLVVGGQHLFTASLEYTYRVLKDWDLAVFYDVGNAFDNEAFELRHGAGVGVHWISPIGPIRLDVAYGLEDEDGGLRLHINMGPDL